MDFVEIILITTAAIGLLLMIITIVRLRADDAGQSGDAYFETGNSIKAINTSLDEAEKAVDEMNKFAESIMKDIEAKHQELLYVYNLIEEKKNEVSGMYGRPAASYLNRPQPAEPAPESKPAAQPRGRRGRNAAAPPQPAAEPQNPETPARRDIHPRYREIMALYDKGASIADISKKLDMGQGEVKLIIELSKA